MRSHQQLRFSTPNIRLLKSLHIRIKITFDEPKHAFHKRLKTKSFLRHGNKNKLKNFSPKSQKLTILFPPASLRARLQPTPHNKKIQHTHKQFGKTFNASEKGNKKTFMPKNEWELLELLIHQRDLSDDSHQGLPPHFSSKPRVLSLWIGIDHRLAPLLLSQTESTYSSGCFDGKLKSKQTTTTKVTHVCMHPQTNTQCHQTKH